MNGASVIYPLVRNGFSLTGPRCGFVFLGHADPERFAEAAPPRIGDDHGTAVLHSLRPAQIEVALRQRPPSRSSHVGASLGPTHAPPRRLSAHPSSATKLPRGERS